MTFARYGARIDGDIGRALRALRSLRDRPEDKIADAPARTQPEPAGAAAPDPALVAARASKPDMPSPHIAGPAPLPLDRHQRRRLEALQRQGQRLAA